MPNPSQVLVPEPLKAFAAGFVRDLTRQGYTPRVIVDQLRLMADVSRWLARKGLEAQSLHSSNVDHFLAVRRSSGRRSYLTRKGMRPLLEHLQMLGAAPPAASTPSSEGPVEVLLERFGRYLTQERGIGSTARNYLLAVRPFLLDRVSPDGSSVDLSHLGAGDVRAFVVSRCLALSRAMLKLTMTALRSLLRFLHLNGAIVHPLTSAVPTVAEWRMGGLPRGLEPEEVQRMLAACDRSTPRGLRDFGLVITCVRLGLRASEVAALELDDIDWKAGELIVRGKGNRHERLPLPVDVGKAMAAYLRRGRPTSCESRGVFLRHVAPQRALSGRGIASRVAAAARRAGLGEVRPHRLRHTAATLMLRAGASLPEIGQVLRHRSIRTTAIYAKVDRDALRSIALPWPGGVQ